MTEKTGIGAVTLRQQIATVKGRARTEREDPDGHYANVYEAAAQTLADHAALLAEVVLLREQLAKPRKGAGEREVIDLTVVRLITAIGTKRFTIDLAKDAVQRLSALDMEVAALVEQRDRMRKALARHGVHLQACRRWRFVDAEAEDGEVFRDDSLPCTCGLTAVLASSGERGK